MNITKLGKLVGDWSNINDKLLQQISNLFKLKNCNIDLDIQKPNNVSPFIKDNLAYYNPDQPFTIKRIFIHLTDWEPGHFYSFDKDIHSGWSAGDVYSVDWHNASYASANAGATDRIILQLTGLVSEESNEFLARLKRFDTYALELKESSW
jgi:hypothetical protein